MRFVETVFDAKPDWPPTPSFLQVYVDDVELRLSRAMDNGATLVTDFVYGERIARFADPWGNLWWINDRTGEGADWDESAASGDESDHVYQSLMNVMRHGPLQ